MRHVNTVSTLKVNARSTALLYAIATKNSLYNRRHPWNGVLPLASIAVIEELSKFSVSLVLELNLFYYRNLNYG